LLLAAVLRQQVLNYQYLIRWVEEGEQVGHFYEVDAPDHDGLGLQVEGPGTYWTMMRRDLSTTPLSPSFWQSRNRKLCSGK